ncbi:MAG: S49 family peptidase [Dehalococcoidales bacterium]
MPRLESAKRLMRHWFTSIPFFVVLGLGLGVLISVLVTPKPMVATITISGEILEQAYTDDVLDLLRQAREDDNIKAVVLQIDSPGGRVSTVEQIYLDVLRLRQQKPVVASIGMVGISGGYYIAVASNYIYAEPTSLLGNIGAWVTLPTPERLDEDVITSGPFKATGGSRRKATGMLEMVRQEFTDAVISQRGDRLNMSEEELSRAEIYVGVESIRHGLIDEIGTSTAAIEKAAGLAGIKNYGMIELELPQPVIVWFIGSSDMEELKSRTSTVPIYYYLYFESE